MKIIGAFFIIVSCGFYGVFFYKRCIQYINFTQGLIDGFEYIKNDISFTMKVLAESLYKASAFSGEAGVFFKKISTELQCEGTTLLNAFEKSEDIIKSTVNKQVYIIVKDSVLQLGKSDAAGQHNLLCTTIEKLEKNLTQQKNFCEKEGVMCKKIGFVAGIALSILLF